jgi:hypothetical protein
MNTTLTFDDANEHERHLVEIEIVDQDVRLLFQMEHTVYDLMRLVCTHWLEDIRGKEDGSIEAHFWTIESNLGEHVGSDVCFLEEQIEEGCDKSTPLSRLSLRVGSILKVMYDMGKSTHFDLRVVSLSVSSDLAFLQALPRLVPPANALPEGVPSLDPQELENERDALRATLLAALPAPQQPKCRRLL